MKTHERQLSAFYLLAPVVLSVYGTQVCPFVEGLGLARLSPSIAIIFLIAFLARRPLIERFVKTPLAGLKLELLIWVATGLILTVYHTVTYQFPLGSGLKVTIGCLAVGLPIASLYGLRLERDEILQAQHVQVRTRPSGPSRSIPTHLYRFVLLSQLLLAAVIILLIIKDLDHLNGAQAGDIKPLTLMVASEVIGAFVVLLTINAMVASTYAKNLHLLLETQLLQMDAVANGDLSAVVPVINNDEMSQIGDRTNTMIASLRERDRIKSVFGKLVSPEVAKRLLDGDTSDTLGGREIEAVVLFTDIRGFTQISSKISAVEVVSLLNEYFSMLVDIVHEEGGTLDKFIGDAAMIVFGLDKQTSVEEASEAALRTAWRIRNQLAMVNASLAARQLPHIDNGFGIHAGTMVAGNIGSTDRLEFTVIGDAVNVAARLEGLCKKTGNWLSVSDALFQRLSVETQSKLVNLGEHAIRGKSMPIAIYGENALSAGKGA